MAATAAEGWLREDGGEAEPQVRAGSRGGGWNSNIFGTSLVKCLTGFQSLLCLPIAADRSGVAGLRHALSPLSAPFRAEGLSCDEDCLADSAPRAHVLLLPPLWCRLGQVARAFPSAATVHMLPRGGRMGAGRVRPSSQSAPTQVELQESLARTVSSGAEALPAASLRAHTGSSVSVAAFGDRLLVPVLASAA